MRRFSWLSAAVLTSLMAQAPADAAAQSGLLQVCGNCRVEKVATCGGFLEGPAIDAKGNVWVTDVTGGRVFRIDASGRCTLGFKFDGHPNGAKFRSDGNLLIADWKGLFLYKPAEGTIERVPLDYEGQPLGDLNDLVVDREGGIYLTAPGRSSLANPNGRVFYRSPAGEVRLLGQGYAYPNGIALTPDGEKVLFSEFTAKRILSIPAVTAKSPFATHYVYATTAGGIGVDGMLVDEKGRLFGANLSAGEVLVYDERARLMGEIPLPDDAGILVTNVVIGNGYLYITEAQKGEVWRVKLAK